MKKRRWFLFLGGLLIFLAVGLFTCTTFSHRNRLFEERLRTFAVEKKPGSEFLLFNGRDLSGWSVHGVGRWTVRDGVLTVRRGIGCLATRCDEFEDFVLRLQIRVGKKGNSGVFFRAHHPGWGLRPWPVGYEAQVDHHDPKNPTGSLYDRVTASPILSRDEEWFEMEISAIGSLICIKINGETVTETTDTTYKKGFIALQAHGPFSRVDFKDIRIRIPLARSGVALLDERSVGPGVQLLGER